MDTKIPEIKKRLSVAALKDAPQAAAVSAAVPNHFQKDQALLYVVMFDENQEPTNVMPLNAEQAKGFINTLTVAYQRLLNNTQ